MLVELVGELDVRKRLLRPARLVGKLRPHAHKARQPPLGKLEEPIDFGAGRLGGSPGGVQIQHPLRQRLGRRDAALAFLFGHANRTAQDARRGGRRLAVALPDGHSHL